MRHTTSTVRRALTLAALAVPAITVATVEVGASETRVTCWPVAADAGNLTGPYNELPDDMVHALVTPTECGVDWPAAADAGAIGA